MEGERAAESDTGDDQISGGPRGETTQGQYAGTETRQSQVGR